MSNRSAPAEIENPGASANATGANVKAGSFENQEYRYRIENARTLAFAIGQCDPRDACHIMQAALSDLSEGQPSAPMFSFMDEANWWAKWASEPELKAYILACWMHLSPQSQGAFLDYVKGRAAA